MSRGRSNLGVLLLLFEIFNVGLDRIPKVTLATIIGQIVIYLRLIPVPSLRQVCASVVEVHYREDYRRLFLASYFHADDWHLYYNMLSFLWKGRSLEPLFGSVYFAAIVAVFGLLTNLVMLLLSAAAEMALHRPSYLSDCAVGFSGVVFALKVVTTHRSPPASRGFLLGLVPVPVRYLVWAELFLIQLITPNASFVGHLAGILVGLAFTCGPLKSLMDSVFAERPRTAARTWGGGRIGQRQDFSAGLTEEEQMRAAVDASLQEASARRPADGDEMRRRRLARFQT